MLFLPWHLMAAYILDLVLGDPRRLPHPIRWIGRLISWVELLLYDKSASPLHQRLSGIAFWVLVVSVVLSATVVITGVSVHLHVILGHIVLVWLAYTTLAVRSLHRESAAVASALKEGDLVRARERLSMIVSRDTSGLDDKDIVRALVETVSENISDGIVAPLFYLALGGPVCGMLYKAVNTMDSMVGYHNERYRYFGWFAAKVDDAANWIPARLSGLLIVGAAACMRLNWKESWKVMRRDARRMKSPNAGYPEAAAAGALGVRLGGTNIYFGSPVEKPTLGDPVNRLSIDTFAVVIRLMYVTSLLALVLAVGIRLGCLFNPV